MLVFVTTASAVRAMLSEHADLPPGDEEPLALPSFTLVVLAESLEQQYGFLVAARELVPDNFGSVARIAAYVDRKRAA